MKYFNFKGKESSDSIIFQSEDNGWNKFKCFRETFVNIGDDKNLFIEVTKHRRVVGEIVHFEKGDLINAIVLEPEENEDDISQVSNFIQSNQTADGSMKSEILQLILSMKTRTVDERKHNLFIYNKESIVNEEQFFKSKNREFFPEFLTYDMREDAIHLTKLRKDILDHANTISPEVKFLAIICTKYPIIKLDILKTIRERKVAAGMLQYRRNLHITEFSKMTNAIIAKFEDKVLDEKIRNFSKEMAIRGLII